MNKIYFIALLALIVLFSGCVQQNAINQDTKKPSVTSGKNVSTQIIENGDIVEVEYKTFVGNDLIDSSEKLGKPLRFKVGAHEVIQGFEEAVLGHRVDDVFEVVVTPDKAYGNKDQRLIVEIPKEKLQQADNIQKGMILTTPDQKHAGMVVEVKSTTIKVDFNHPLAGKTLKFWIKIVGLEKSN